MTCTIYKDIYSFKEPRYITVQAALERIRSGKSRDKVAEIRAAIDKEKQDVLKLQLPAVCFSGQFATREDSKIIQHSGFIVLDFDSIENIDELAAKIYSDRFTYAMWLSPRGNGLKTLIRIADGARHREHFAALREKYPQIDKSGVNESRVCFESYDPNIYINEQAEIFTKTLTFERIEATKVIENQRDVFQNLLKWQANKGGAFVKGERNAFIFKLAGACCRFGIGEDEAVSLILSEYPASNDFTAREAQNTIKSAYKRNNIAAGSAQFERDVLVDKVTRKEVDIDASVYDLEIAPKDIIYGQAVKENAIDIFCNGYAKISGIGLPAIDERWKSKKGELTGLTGIGNYGKSSFYKWYKLVRILLYGEKFVTFAPEDNPPEEYYHDFVEMLLGKNCTPFMFDGKPNLDKPSPEEYFHAYDFISNYVFYMYPKDDAPTLDYVLERFLEMVIKEKVAGCCIDPWNQVMHDYKGFGSNASKYLEYALGRIARFAQTNDVYMDIIVHPKMMPKASNGNYECPDIFDVNDGAMWNNKLDNLLVYHRPFGQTNRDDPTCEFHSKKIKRQKSVGKPGVSDGMFRRGTRRFEFDGVDQISYLLSLNRLDFTRPVKDFTPAQLPSLGGHPMAGIVPHNTRDPSQPNDFSTPPF